MAWVGPQGEPPLVKALLGPTNTGKTHAAVERMLEHASGMIGLPLRLLAREVYDRISARVGEGAVALVTGEEKRVPAHPRYWVCTVEAMPELREPGLRMKARSGELRAALEVGVDFLAVDEIQLGAHRERGHVFTDRLLHWRGRRETWFMGADTMRPLVQRLVPGATIHGRPRLSSLTHAGGLTIGTLPPRTAVVAFSAARVYQLAERLRGKRGGAAVVLGALSPRARNAQVALYQSGEVDYLVATDAIGMGLNMDVDCVAFADVRKFDGRESRALDEAELAQIAGRAGRHHNDGRFATLAPLAPLSPAVTRAIEQHRFPVVTRLQWRNRALDTSSISALRASLALAPFDARLERIEEAADERALLHLSRNPKVAAVANGREAVSLLWEVCGVPDFRHLPMDDHFALLAEVYLQLCTTHGRLAGHWIDAHVARLDDLQGDLDTLLDRLAAIRTWTYITHQPRWVEDAAAWQARTRAIEDRLSDALHEALVNRFVDVSARKRGPARKSGGSPGHTLAEQLQARGLVQEPKPTAASLSRDEADLEELVSAPHDRFRLEEDGRLWAGDRAIARLVAGPDLLRPEVAVTLDVGPGARLRLSRRLLAWTRDLVTELVGALRGLPSTLAPAAAGLVYLVERGLGTVCARDAREQLRGLDGRARAALIAAGLVVGHHVVYLPRALAPAALRARAGLVAPHVPGRLEIPDAPSFAVRDLLADELHTALGYPIFGSLAVRADVAELVGTRLRAGADPREIARRLVCAPEAVPFVRAAFELPRARVRR